jgi:hypothetical protein
VLADETERFALDKRQALLQAMSLMERAGRKGMAETA